ncbi:MAG: dihydroorotate dehydrogenase [Gemmatimonadota bacterium]|nr:dihydroorotate dehydrogenase [Gemmatimonadota bacterium]
MTSGVVARRTAVDVAGVVFQNPVVLAAGTAGYAREIDDVIDLDRLGGIVTKAVSPEPRQGNPPLRVADFRAGMINAVGLANPGLEAVRREHLAWLGTHVPNTRKLVNVVGSTPDDFPTVVMGIEEILGVGAVDRSAAVDGYELNVSCPNVKAGGAEFVSDPDTLAMIVSQVRAVTRRRIFVKLSPTLPDIASTARVAVGSGADGLTVVNTIPGLVVDVKRRRPALGFGTGGVSGPGLLPVGVLATWKVHRAVRAPVMGVGGVSSAEDALQYMLAGASLVGVGTAALKDPKRPERIVRDLERWCDREGIRSIAEIVGTLEWPG